MFRALYRRLRKRKSSSHEREQQEGEQQQQQPSTLALALTTLNDDAPEEVAEEVVVVVDDEVKTTTTEQQVAEIVEQESKESEEAAGSTSSTTSSTTVASKSQQTLPRNTNQLKLLATRQQMIMLLSRLCDEAEGDIDTNHIVLELLGSYNVGLMMPSSSSSSSLSTAAAAAAAASCSPIDRVCKQLLGVLREQTLIDAGISLGNERYRCFESVLKNYTKLYAARRFIEQLPELSEGDEVVISAGTANEVLHMPVLLRQLWSSLDKMEFFNEDAAFKAYLEARHHPEARILSDLLLTRISRVFLCIVSSTMFLEFTEQELLHILRNCYLSVNSEIEIFLAMVLWLEHNWLEPDNCPERLLSEVRFGLMPTWYLSTMARANRCQHFGRVICSPGVQELIQQGMEDAITLKSKQRFSCTTTVSSSSGSGGTSTAAERAKPKSLMGESHLPRDWIVDIECSHHHKCHCRYFIYPTYDVFKSNLARIICRSSSYWHSFRPAQEVYRSDFRCCSTPSFD